MKNKEIWSQIKVARKNLVKNDAIIVMFSFQGYRVYIYQWEAEIVALRLFKCEFGEYEILEGTYIVLLFFRF